MHRVTACRAQSLVRNPGSLWPWLALAVALLQTGVARAEIQSRSPSRALSLLGEGEHPAAARLTPNGLGLLGEPDVLPRLTPSAPQVGAPWSAVDAARIERAPASAGKPSEQPTPLRWSAGSLHGPVLLGQQDSPLVPLVTPALMVVSNWWLAYRYRTAYDITTLSPLFTVGLSLNGDLL